MSKKLSKKRSVWNRPMDKYRGGGSEIFDNLPKYKLLLSITEGTNLAPKDLNGFSDPYVKVFVNGEKLHKTKIIKKTLNPIWGEECSYYFHKEISDKDEILFHVWDWDRLSSDDSMGICKLQVNTLLGDNLGKSLEKKITLVPKKKEKVRGTITYTVKLIEVDEKFTISVRREYLVNSTSEILLKCFSYLYIKDFFKKEGIFRKACSFVELSKLKADMVNEAPIHLNDIENAHVVSCFIKQFLRDLEEPIFTFDKYYEFLECLEEEDTRKRVAKLKKILEMLPEQNYESVNVLFVFLEEVEKYEKDNLMTSENLGIVFSPNILRCKDDLNNLKNMAKTNELVNFMIEEVSKLFKKGNIEEVTKDTLLKLKSKHSQQKKRPKMPRKSLRAPLQALKEQFSQEKFDKELALWKKRWKDEKLKAQRLNKRLKEITDKMRDVKKRTAINQGDLTYLKKADLIELKEILNHSLRVVEKANTTKK